jgi:hypothetical protein
MDDILKIANASHLSISEAERVLKTGTHGMTGVYISRECWQLPREVEELIALHETTEHAVREKRTARSLTTDEHKAFEILSLADTLAHRFGYSFPVFQRDVRVSAETLEILGISKETLLATVKQTKSEVEELEFNL